jgi:hypothetical protein
MDWSSLHAQRHLGVSAVPGALAFAGFVTAMTNGRFTADRVTATTAPVWVVCYGSALAAGGYVVGIVSTSLRLTVLGWVIVGLGQLWRTAAGLLACWHRRRRYGHRSAAGRRQRLGVLG